jgi:hypothetical protein
MSFQILLLLEDFFFDNHAFIDNRKIIFFEFAFFVMTSKMLLHSIRSSKFIIVAFLFFLPPFKDFP